MPEIFVFSHSSKGFVRQRLQHVLSRAANVRRLIFTECLPCSDWLHHNFHPFSLAGLRASADAFDPRPGESGSCELYH